MRVTRLAIVCARGTTCSSRAPGIWIAQPVPGKIARQGASGDDLAFLTSSSLSARSSNNKFSSAARWSRAPVSECPRCSSVSSFGSSSAACSSGFEDDIEPRIKLARRIKPFQRLKGVHERILDRVERVLAIAEDAGRLPHRLALITLDQVAKRLPVSRSTRSDGSRIVHCCLSL